MIIIVRQLGLAAYIKMQGEELVKVEGKDFHFTSKKTLAEYRVDYHNSCCMRHDSLVCDLRQHLKEAAGG